MRYKIEVKKDSESDPSKCQWSTDESLCKLAKCFSNDESEIMSSFVKICRSNPNIVSRHSMRIFDSYLFDWVVLTKVPNDFTSFVDPICFFWNFYLPEDHPLYKFRKEK